MAELGLFICVLGTSFGLVRIFGDYGFMGRLAVVAAAASALAALLRRRGIGMVASSALHLGVGFVAMSNLFLFSTTRYGVPTLTTLGRARTLAVDSFAELRSSVPPIETSTGLLIVVAVAIWVLTLFADTAAFRVQAPVQAVLPLTATFIALGIPETSVGRVESVLVFGVALGTYALTAQYSRDRNLRWLRRDPSELSVRRSDGNAGGALRLTGAATSMVVAAALVAALATAIVPPKKPVVKLRGNGTTGGRVVTTPFVGIRNLLGERSNIEMFTVDTDAPSYWRLTALDTYDTERDIWISSGKYSKLAKELPRSTSPSVEVGQLRQHFKVSGLTGPWIPAAFEPVEYRGDPQATYSEETSTLFADNDVDRGDSFDIVSDLPAFSTDALASLESGVVLDPSAQKLLEAPEQSPIVSSILDDIVLRSSGPYEGMLALQDWFRSAFDYDETADYSESSDPVSEFLSRRLGFCQQFSSVFALMARDIGLPSRVAVGFTMGEEKGEPNPEDGARTFVVKGLHAHAWPEVLFPGLGWVAFEPTPGRGNPATTAFTGIAAGQSSSEAEGATTTSVAKTSTSSTVVGGPPTSVGSGSPQVVPPRDDSKSADERSGMNLVLIITGAGLLVAVAVGLVIVLSRRKKTSPTDSPPLDPDSRSVFSAWNAAVADVARVGTTPRNHETPLEFAKRLAAEVRDRLAIASPGASHTSTAQLGDEAVLQALQVLEDQMLRLASIETLRRYSAEFEVTPLRDQVAIDALVDESDRRRQLVSAAVDRLVEGVARVPAPTVVDVTH